MECPYRPPLSSGYALLCTAAVLTISDKDYAGEREDASSREITARAFHT